VPGRRVRVEAVEEQDLRLVVGSATQPTPEGS
jgi:hypothetical protein